MQYGMNGSPDFGDIPTLPFALVRELPYRRAVLATGMYGEHCPPVRIRANRFEVGDIPTVPKDGGRPWKPWHTQRCPC